MTPKEAHIRNRIQCLDCGHYFRASKFLPREVVAECKDADAYGLYIYPGIVCGKCGRKYWTRSDSIDEFMNTLHAIDAGECHGLKRNTYNFNGRKRGVSKRRHKIHIQRLMESQKWSDNDY